MSAPTWDLEVLFPGGPTGDAATQALAASQAEIAALHAAGAALPPLPEGLEAWSEWLLLSEQVVLRGWRLSAFGSCVSSQDANDSDAERFAITARGLWSKLALAWVGPNDQLVHCDQAAFDALIGRPELADLRASLERSRAQRHLLLPRAEQALATQLSEDGIKAWGQLYDRVMGQLTAELPEGTVSAGQLATRMGSVDRAVRNEAFEALGVAWGGQADTCAKALTHIVGTRHTLNTRRGVDELEDALAGNRVQRESLEALLEAARRAGPILQEYLELKAQILGVDQLSWSDQSAPLPSPAAAQTFDQGRDFILEQFGRYHPDLLAFGQQAFDERWIEAEDRSGKRPGGWCTFAPGPQQSRIFMTWGGSFRSTVTLAHELGHAYHNHVTRDLTPSMRSIPSTLAETASVFAESLVRDAALRAADSRAARMAMLDARLSAGVAFLMNIPARFDFERALYGMRANGHLIPDALSEETVACQRRWYRDSLSSWDPLFWCSKLHFYISGRAFYNYPYAYGYLFAQLVYRRVLDEGPSAHGQYVELLRRTGWQGGEDLARETLGLDLTQWETWYQAAAPLREDLDALKAAFEEESE
jgi:pepF/M3 family oligoendopeptidase